MANEWLLTEEERKRAWLEHEQSLGFNPSLELYDEVEDGQFKAAAQAQLRKVWQRLMEDCLDHYPEPYRKRIDCTGCWAELRQEAGLDA